MTNDLKTTDHITIDEIIRQAGGFEELKGTLQEFEEINFRIDSQHETLLTSYPLKVGSNGQERLFQCRRLARKRLQSGKKPRAGRIGIRGPVSESEPSGHDSMITGKLDQGGAPTVTGYVTFPVLQRE